MAFLTFAQFIPTSGSFEALELATARASGQDAPRLLLLSSATVASIAAGYDGNVRRGIGALARRQFDERCETTPS